MQRFAQLYRDLEDSTKTLDKLAALRSYFAEAPAADAAWALYFLTGQKIKRAVNTRVLRTCIAELTGLPDWLVDESYDAVGDLGETLAWLAPSVTPTEDESLAETVERRIQSLVGLDAAEQSERVKQTWRELSDRERLVFNKLITSEFRVGAARTLVTRALGELAGVDQPTMAHRLSGAWSPTAEAFDAIMHGADEADPAHPYPFFLAHPLEGDPAALGSPGDWQAEWKWDGIRSEVVRRGETLAVWSRGEELVTDRFPELLPAFEKLPSGTVLDGEIMAWRTDAALNIDSPLPFAVLQKRIGRLRVTPKIQADAPVALVAYDLLEHEGVDIRPLPLVERRARLEQIISQLVEQRVRLSPTVAFDSWDELKQRWLEARERGVEGLMLKRRDAPYGVGRQRGPWWKWKSQPFSIDAVLIYAQPGHGRRASLLTDYTFGLWDEGVLVPVAKAYSGLTDDEIRQVDAFIRQHTTEKFGPVRVVEPRLVFELHFEGVQKSTRHKSGVAVRFPRMHRWRQDKQPADADMLATLKAMAQ
jgi:DNA ligase-1